MANTFFKTLNFQITRQLRLAKSGGSHGVRSDSQQAWFISFSKFKNSPKKIMLFPTAMIPLFRE